MSLSSFLHKTDALKFRVKNSDVDNHENPTNGWF
jgi:hypothetical protein